MLLYIIILHPVIKIYLTTGYAVLLDTQGFQYYLPKIIGLAVPSTSTFRQACLIPMK